MTDLLFDGSHSMTTISNILKGQYEDKLIIVEQITEIAVGWNVDNTSNSFMHIFDIDSINNHLKIIKLISENKNKIKIGNVIDKTVDTGDIIKNKKYTIVNVPDMFMDQFVDKYEKSDHDHDHDQTKNKKFVAP